MFVLADACWRLPNLLPSSSGWGVLWFLCPVPQTLLFVRQVAMVSGTEAENCRELVRMQAMWVRVWGTWAHMRMSNPWWISSWTNTANEKWIQLNLYMILSQCFHSIHFLDAGTHVHGRVQQGLLADLAPNNCFGQQPHAEPSWLLYSQFSQSWEPECIRQSRWACVKHHGRFMVAWNLKVLRFMNVDSFYTTLVV